MTAQAATKSLDWIKRREALARSLRTLLPNDALLTEIEDRRPYECDGLSAYRRVPGLMALPRSIDEVAAVLKCCQEQGVPVVTRGAGTGLSGGALPHEQGLLLSLARLPQLNAVKLPAGVDEAKLRSILLNDYSLEVGAGLGALAGKILRIGLMGHACNRRNISLCLSALATALPQAQATTTKVAQT